MKILFIVVVVLLSIDTATAQGRIQVSITNFKSDKGVCRLCLFNNVEAYNGEIQHPVKCLSLPVKSKRAVGAFENIPEGHYAIFAFHDANNNNIMDKNFIGVPKEGYGASMNKLPFASAPTYEENKFSLHDKSSKEIIIRLRNLMPGP